MKAWRWSGRFLMAALVSPMATCWKAMMSFRVRSVLSQPKTHSKSLNPCRSSSRTIALTPAE